MADSRKHWGSDHHFKQQKPARRDFNPNPTCEECGKDISRQEDKRNHGLCDSCCINVLHGGGGK